MSESAETKALLLRIAGGDEVAVGLLLDRQRLRLRRLVQARLDPRVNARLDPSDVVQEILVDAHRRLPEYLATRPIDFYPWLTQIATNRLIDLHRRHVRAGRRTVSRETHFTDSQVSAKSLADSFFADDAAVGHLIREELRARVEHAISQLSPDMQQVLSLRHVEHRSVAEIAALCDVTEATIRSRHFRALAQLRKLLKPDASENE